MAEIQTAYYMVAATGVLVAAFYYVLSIRETTKNRRVTLAHNLMQTFISEEGSRRWIDLMNMEWTDFEDYMRKYDSSVNPENFAKRNTVWNTCDVIGYLYRLGIMDMDTIFAVSGPAVLLTWVKFKPIIDEYRKMSIHSRVQYKYWEYLASEIAKTLAHDDPSYRGAADIVKPEEYDRAK